MVRCREPMIGTRLSARPTKISDIPRRVQIHVSGSRKKTETTPLRIRTQMMSLERRMIMRKRKGDKRRGGERVFPWDESSTRPRMGNNPTYSTTLLGTRIKLFSSKTYH